MRKRAQHEEGKQEYHNRQPPHCRLLSLVACQRKPGKRDCGSECETAANDGEGLCICSAQHAHWWESVHPDYPPNRNQAMHLRMCVMRGYSCISIEAYASETQ
jgi:hypothetical protein